MKTTAIITVMSRLWRDIEITIPELGVTLADLPDDVTADIWRTYELERRNNFTALVDILYSEPSRGEVYLKDVRFYKSGIEQGILLNQYNLDLIEDKLSENIVECDREQAHGY